MVAAVKKKRTKKKPARTLLAFNQPNDMSLRDYIAINVLQGLVASDNYARYLREKGIDASSARRLFATTAYQMAAEMMIERKKR